MGEGEGEAPTPTPTRRTRKRSVGSATRCAAAEDRIQPKRQAPHLASRPQARGLAPILRLPRSRQLTTCRQLLRCLIPRPGSQLSHLSQRAAYPSRTAPPQAPRRNSPRQPRPRLWPTSRRRGCTTKWSTFDRATSCVVQGVRNFQFATRGPGCGSSIMDLY